MNREVFVRNRAGRSMGNGCYLARLFSRPTWPRVAGRRAGVSSTRTGRNEDDGAKKM